MHAEWLLATCAGTHMVQRHANVKVGTWPAIPALDCIALVIDTQGISHGSFLAYMEALPLPWGSVLVNMMASDDAFEVKIASSQLGTTVVFDSR